MFRREMGSKRVSLPPKEEDLTCMPWRALACNNCFCLNLYLISDWVVNFRNEAACTLIKGNVITISDSKLIQIAIVKLRSL